MHTGEGVKFMEKIRHIAIIGAGLMGHGIAQEFAAAGYFVQPSRRKRGEAPKCTHPN